MVKEAGSPTPLRQEGLANLHAQTKQLQPT